MYLGEEGDYKSYFCVCQTVIIPDCKKKEKKYYASVKPDVGPSNSYFKDTHTNEKIHANLFCCNANVIAATLICFAFHVSCSKGNVSI